MASGLLPRFSRTAIGADASDSHSLQELAGALCNRIRTQPFARGLSKRSALQAAIEADERSRRALSGAGEQAAHKLTAKGFALDQRWKIQLIFKEVGFLNGDGTEPEHAGSNGREEIPDIPSAIGDSQIVCRI